MAGPATSARIFDRFLAACRARPRATAIVHAGGEWTYDQVERASRALAAQLLAAPAPNEIVALYSRRAPELVVGMLACLRAGLTFAVLDAAYPRERLEQLLAVASPGRLVTFALTRDDEAVLAALRVPDVVLRVDGEAVAALLRSDAGAVPGLDEAVATSIAYLFFTSGTTGVPKCIRTAHSPLVHFIDWYAKAFAVDAERRFSMLSGLGHDPVLRDVFVPLSTGAQLHVPLPATLLDPAKLYAWMADAGLTHAHVTPQLCRVICSGRREQAPLEALAFVFSGGDVLRRKQVADVLAAAPRARVVNFYGATETPQAMGHHVYDPVVDDTDVVPIGRGIDDVQLLVLDDELRLAPVGTRGQIVIRTKFLSAGYLGDSGLTSKKFVPHPDGLDPEDRLFLTGDVGYFRRDGAVMAEGRLDDQVKIRGFRVELGEVVHHLESQGAVAGAAVLAERAPDGENRLVAYLLERSPTRDPAAATAALKAALAGAVPAYMIPFQCVWLKAFPLLPNGKIDRAKLPAQKPVDDGASLDAPSDPVEAEIASQWKAILGAPSIDVGSSFLELGGDSLSFITAATQLEAVLGWLPEGWEKLSIRELAREKRAQRSPLTRIDSAVLMRAISIVAIVAAHFGFPNLAGSTRALFVVSGMSFGKYLVPAVLRTSRVSPILSLAFRIALPTVLYTLLVDLAFIGFKWPAMLLINNLIAPDFEHGGFAFWFINVLVQNQLILAGLLAIPAVRALVRRDAFAFAISATFVLAALAAVTPYFWDTTPLYDHVPHLYLGAMCLGWAVVEANSPQRRLLVLAATVVTFAGPAVHTYGHSHELLVMPFVATVFLVYRRQVTLPVYVGRLVNLMAGASLFTYLTDLQFKTLASKTPLAHSRLGMLLLALVGGIVVWKLWDAAYAVAARKVRRALT